MSYLPTYNHLDPALPAGWKIDGMPAFMSDLLKDPAHIADYELLTEPQKWALITARVRKSPNFKNEFSRLSQSDILLELRKKSKLGEAIRDLELEELWVLRNKLLNEKI